MGEIRSAILTASREFQDRGRHDGSGLRRPGGCPATFNSLRGVLNGRESDTFWIGVRDVAEPGAPRRGEADQSRRLPGGVEFLVRGFERTPEVQPKNTWTFGLQYL